MLHYYFKREKINTKRFFVSSKTPKQRYILYAKIFVPIPSFCKKIFKRFSSIINKTVCIILPMLYVLLFSVVYGDLLYVFLFIFVKSKFADLYLRYDFEYFIF